MNKFGELLLKPIPRRSPVTKDTIKAQDWHFELSNEPVVDVSTVKLASSKIYQADDASNWPYCDPISVTSTIYLRQGVVECLLAANRELERYGLELLILDGLRTLQEQESLWAYFLQRVMERDADLDLIAAAEKAREYCWDPTTFYRENPLTWPVHMTGGAVDLTLRSSKTGGQCFMGSVFDDASCISHTDHFEIVLENRGGQISALTSSEQAALVYRRVLFHTLEEAGLTNYSSEWWHFDLRTVLQAARRGNGGRATIYGVPANAPL